MNNENSPFDVICNVAFFICLLLCTCCFLYMGCEFQRNNKEIQEKYDKYLQLKQEYDTTTPYNKLVTYEKMKAME